MALHLTSDFSHADMDGFPSSFDEATHQGHELDSPGSYARSGRRTLANLQAGLAELVLLNRLRAHTRTDLTADTLERAAKVIEVTCRHWFGLGVEPLPA